MIKPEKTTGKRRISELIPYDRNPRNNKDAIEGVLESLKKHGQVKPIVISAEGHPFEKETICAGHTTVEALKKFGADEVDVVVKQFVDEAEFVDYNIRDNKSAEKAEWNEAELVKLSQDFAVDLGEMDFDIPEAQEQTEGNTDEDEIPEDAPPVCQLGDVWQLGEHRLMCGDSTDEKQVVKLLDGMACSICFTSPPYNVGGSVDNKKGHKQMYINSADNMVSYDMFLIKFTQIALDYCSYVFVNLQGLSNNQKDIFRYTGNHAKYLKDVFIWNKKNAPPNIQKGSFGTKFEYIFCFSNHDNKGRNFPCEWQGKHFNVVECETNLGQQESEDHRAGFPLNFPLWFLEKMDFARYVFDPFGGTGTTLIACEKTNRKCRMMELDPKYCDVIIKRWEDFTGEKAKRLKP